MYTLFEESDRLNSPVECFVFDTRREKFPVRPHWHYFIELIYVYQGTVRITAGAESYTLAPDEMAVFHPKVIHSIENAENCDVPPIYAVMKFDINRLRMTSDYAPKLREIFREAEKHPCASILISAAQNREIGTELLIKSCIKEMSARDYGYGTVLDSQLYVLLTQILRVWRRTGFVVMPAPYKVNENDSIYTITEYIDAHSSENLKVSELAKKCGMSYSYFAKCFRDLYKQSCKNFINFIRVSKACDYLMFTSFDMSYIGQETGFSDCSHFVKTFHTIKGITPKQFRLKNRQEAL
ncbi:MAG: AraC family transcriptional regulator [Oscillospiraceae bacterium]